MEVFGLVLAIIIGVFLGITGAGGSILTIPVLVYIIGLNPEISISYSLFVVGSTALLGAFSYLKNKNIDIRAAIAFSIPSITTVALTRTYLLSKIPNTFTLFHNIIITKELLMMVTFGVLMLLASASMIKQQQEFRRLSVKAGENNSNYYLIIIEGAMVGMLTGFVGAGGGFLIIPSLVLFAGVPMKKAIGTSLLIISINSLTGFTGDLIRGITIDWIFLLSFSSLAFIGILIGVYASKYIEASKMKPAFGYFILVMGVFIVLKELLFKFYL